jgi:hypothetical protein
LDKDSREGIANNSSSYGGGNGNLNVDFSNENAFPNRVAKGPAKGGGFSFKNQVSQPAKLRNRSSLDMRVEDLKDLN